MTTMTGLDRRYCGEQTTRWIQMACTQVSSSCTCQYRHQDGKRCAIMYTVPLCNNVHCSSALRGICLGREKLLLGPIEYLDTN